MKRYLAAPSGAVVLLLAASVAWAQSLPAAKPEEVGLSAQRLAKIEQVFKQEVEQGRLPGAVVMVARKGKLAYQTAVGFQDRAKDIPMRADSIFRIYSMTKPLASVAAMMLVEDGRIQLTDPIARWLPEMKSLQVSAPRPDASQPAMAFTLVPTDRPPTVYDLLRHTAGLAYGEITANAPAKAAYVKAKLVKSDIDYEARDLTPDEQIQALAAAPLIHQPGTTWEYSLAVDVLGRVVERASGQRLGTFLEERMFKPLKMVDTSFAIGGDRAPRLAEPLAIDPATGRPNKLIDVSQPPKNDSGGAGAVSTAGDYLRFAQAMLDGGQLDGQRIVSRTTVGLMASDHLGSYIRRTAEPGELLMGVKGYTFGLGFMVRQDQGLAAVPGSAGEFMWAGYAGTFFWIDPKEQLVAVLMTQAPGPSRPYYRRELKQLVYQAIVD